MSELRRLPCDLTREEVEVRAAELARTIDARDAAEEARKDADKEAKATIKSQTTKIADLADVVRTKQERRPVECEWQPNVDRQTMDLVRSDTRQVVETRAMTTEDRQQHLPGMGKRRTRAGEE